MRLVDRPAAYAGLLIALVVAGVMMVGLGVALGSVRIPLAEVWAILADQLGLGGDAWWTQARERIVLDSRLPRVITAALVGACLALAGGVSQAVTRNPLADPYLLGVSSGAGFGVVLVSVAGVGAGALGWFTIPAAAFVGGLIPLAVSLVIGGRFRQSTAVILVGVAMGQIFSALITFFLLVVANEQQLSTVMHWLAGGFGASRWETVAAPAVGLVVVGSLLLASGRRLDLLHTGDDGAAALGMNVRRFRVWQLLGVSLLAGLAVAVAGGIGFIGLLIPHLAGFLVGISARRLLPVAALLGAVAMMGADTLARSIDSRIEVPVGVITALVGAPVFVVMLLRRYRRETS